MAVLSDGMMACTMIPLYYTELRERVTDYERNHNINRFIFSTPFTVDGSARGELQVQGPAVSEQER